MNEKFFKILPLLGIGFVVLLMFLTSKPTESNTQLKSVLNSQATSNPATQNTNNSNNLQGNQNMQKTQMPLPTQVIDVNKTYYAKFETNLGNFKIKLHAKEAPLTVNNFVYLAQNKYYDGLIFHRIIKDFMIQGGDPLGSGSGGPGYKFGDEQSGKKLVKGSLAMANAGPNTNGSQFFIVTAASTPWLDGKHTNFGEVVEGLDVVEKMSLVKTGQNDRPVENITINKLDIITE
jgi:cyclophilin family peptidyl-prolyl cis-trans isomerase